MTGTRQKYDEEFKRNAVRLSFASSRTTKEVGLGSREATRGVGE